MDNHQILSEFFGTKKYKRVSNPQESHPLDAFIKFPKGHKDKNQKPKAAKHRIKSKKRTHTRRQARGTKQKIKKTIRKRQNRKRQNRKKQNTKRCCTEVAHLQQLINNLKDEVSNNKDRMNKLEQIKHEVTENENKNSNSDKHEAVKTILNHMNAKKTNFNEITRSPTNINTLNKSNHINKEEHIHIDNHDSKYNEHNNEQHNEEDDAEEKRMQRIKQIDNNIQMAIKNLEKKFQRKII